MNRRGLVVMLPYAIMFSIILDNHNILWRRLDDIIKVGNMGTINMHSHSPPPLPRSLFLPRALRIDNYTITHTW